MKTFAGVPVPPDFLDKDKLYQAIRAALPADAKLEFDSYDMSEGCNNLFIDSPQGQVAVISPVYLDAQGKQVVVDDDGQAWDILEWDERGAVCQQSARSAQIGYDVIDRFRNCQEKDGFLNMEDAIAEAVRIYESVTHSR